MRELFAEGLTATIQPSIMEKVETGRYQGIIMFLQGGTSRKAVTGVITRTGAGVGTSNGSMEMNGIDPAHIWGPRFHGKEAQRISVMFGL
jgi:hypothetical protein